MKFLERYPLIVDVIALIGCASSALIIRQSDAPSVVLATWRLICTVLLLSPVVWGKRSFRKEILNLPKKTVMMSAVSGIFLAIHFATWFESLKHTSVASTTVLVATEVIWVAIGFCVFLKGKLEKKAILAILITLAGSVLIALADSRATGNNLYGDCLALIAAVAIAGYTLLGRVVRTGTSTTVYTYIVYVFCAAGLGLITLAVGAPMSAGGWKTILIGLILAVVCTILGHSAYSWCLKYFSPAFVSATKLCQPVVASIGAIFLLGEYPVALQIIGGAVALLGVVYYSVIEIRKNKSGIRNL